MFQQRTFIVGVLLFTVVMAVVWGATGITGETTDDNSDDGNNNNNHRRRLAGGATTTTAPTGGTSNSSSSQVGIISDGTPYNMGSAAALVAIVICSWVYHNNVTPEVATIEEIVQKTKVAIASGDTVMLRRTRRALRSIHDDAESMAVCNSCAHMLYAIGRYDSFTPDSVKQLAIDTDEVGTAEQQRQLKEQNDVVVRQSFHAGRFASFRLQGAAASPMVDGVDILTSMSSFGASPLAEAAAPLSVTVLCLSFDIPFHVLQSMREAEEASADAARGGGAGNENDRNTSNNNNVMDRSGGIILFSSSTGHSMSQSQDTHCGSSDHHPDASGGSRATTAAGGGSGGSRRGKKKLDDLPIPLQSFYELILDAVKHCVESYGGTVEHFLGDYIFVSFNGLRKVSCSLDDTHAQRAADCAVSLTRRLKAVPTPTPTLVIGMATRVKAMPLLCGKALSKRSVIAGGGAMSTAAGLARLGKRLFFGSGTAHAQHHAPFLPRFLDRHLLNVHVFSDYSNQRSDDRSICGFKERFIGKFMSGEDDESLCSHYVPPGYEVFRSAAAGGGGGNHHPSPSDNANSPHDSAIIVDLSVGELPLDLTGAEDSREHSFLVAKLVNAASIAAGRRNGNGDDDNRRFSAGGAGGVGPAAAAAGMLLGDSGGGGGALVAAGTDAGSPTGTHRFSGVEFRTRDDDGGASPGGGSTIDVSVSSCSTSVSDSSRSWQAGSPSSASRHELPAIAPISTSLSKAQWAKSIEVRNAVLEAVLAAELEHRRQQEENQRRLDESGDEHDVGQLIVVGGATTEHGSTGSTTSSTAGGGSSRRGGGAEDFQQQKTYDTFDVDYWRGILRENAPIFSPGEKEELMTAVLSGSLPLHSELI